MTAKRKREARWITDARLENALKLSDELNNYAFFQDKKSELVTSWKEHSLKVLSNLYGLDNTQLNALIKELSNRQPDERQATCLPFWYQQEFEKQRDILESAEMWFESQGCDTSDLTDSELLEKLESDYPGGCKNFWIVCAGD